MTRQGDVLFTATGKKIPAMAKKRTDNCVAYGEVTGHAHAVMTPETAEVVEIDGSVMVRVSERGIAIDGDIARLVPDLKSIVNDETELPERRDSARRLLFALPTAGAIFLHGTVEERRERPVPGRDEDRHLPIALRPGNHYVDIQREWSPEEIRNVTD